MKDLSIEEKAKRYDDAIKKAKTLYDNSLPLSGCNVIIESIFSEFKESEDERIRKALIKYFSEGMEYLSLIPYSKEQCVSWLEKQGKQKEINLVEILKHYPKETELYSPLYGKLWLAEVDEKNEIINCYKHPLDEGCTRAVLEQENTVSFYSNGTTGLPDFNVSKDCMLFLYDIEKQGEQKDILDEAVLDNNEDGLVADTIKYNIKQKPAWSEDDEYYRNIILYILNNEYVGKTDKENAINWLKSIRPQNNITDEELAQAKKDAYNEALDKIEYHSGSPTFDDGWSAAIWYLKKRNARLQTQWKPSDEQMKALDIAIRWGIQLGSLEEIALRSLLKQLEDLKKLKNK